MKQLLTKEQAEYLRYVAREMTRLNPDTHIPVDYVLLERVINQCTEKPFPLFDRHMDDCAVDISLYCEHYIKIYLEQREPAFTFENFKIFAKACQDIVVWIEENK